MNVLLVHDWLTGMRGGEKCLDVLCRRFPDARLFTLLHRPGCTSPAIERMQITTSCLQRFPGDYRYALPLMPRAIESLVVPADVELVVSLSHAVAKGIRVPPGVRHVCYCFTPMRWAWHLREDYFGRRSSRSRWFVRPLEIARERLLARLRRWDRSASSHVNEFVAISQTVARRIEECYGRTSQVIYPPVDTEFYTPAAGPREDFYLVLSALVPYKRVEVALEACRRLGKRLIIVGSGPLEKHFRQRSSVQVELLGWQPAEVVRELLRRASALLFPGHEDFGIVPVEAQACGTPVIAYAQGGATETVLPADESHDGTGVFFSEQTPEALAAAIRWFEAHRDRCCAKLARQQAERFTTARFEREIMELLVPTESASSVGAKVLSQGREPLDRIRD